MANIQSRSDMTNIQVRHGTSAQWSSANPTLAAGEPGIETDTKKVKIGDGTTAWNSLKYFGIDGGQLNLNAVTTLPPPPPPPPPPPLAGTFSLSGAGTSSANGCYSNAGTYNGKPYYTNGTLFIWYDTSVAPELWWNLTSELGGGTTYYISSQVSNSNQPTESWQYGANPQPTQSQGC